MRKIFPCILGCCLLAGCSGGANNTDLQNFDTEQTDTINNSIGAAIGDTQDVPQFPVYVEDDANAVFFDGGDFSIQGMELLDLVKARSHQTFENLNTAFAEGSVTEDFLECSLSNPGSVLYGFACDEDENSRVLDEYGFPLFLILPENPELCQALPLGAFNVQDCEINTLNFISDSGLYGYYRSSVTFEGVKRETLSITENFVPPFVDPTFAPETCVFEVHGDGTLLLSDFGNCTNSIDQLIAEFSSQ